MFMISMLINIMFMSLSHPLSMGVTLILQTLIVALWSGKMMKTFWMSYVLAITMLSGMLVLFIYMSSMASNEKFKSKPTLLLIIALFLIMSLLMTMLTNKILISNNYWGLDLKTVKSSELMALNKIFISKTNLLTMMIVIYLLLTMVVSTHLVNISEGPLRMKI
uniref:NADH-ubiquinone oxidoreductase chain 6 n=1 Tax=Lasiolabops cosmopolites TaxID=2813038 RepID=A0A8T9ZXV2_9HEMI|nr:NADH dehydrogenase subunit 6 [Lasiolabops cosmopolites]